MRMVDLGDGPGLALEPLDALRGLRPVWFQNLDGDSPVETRVCRAIDLAHASRAELRKDGVWTESHAWLHSLRLSAGGAAPQGRRVR